MKTPSNLLLLVAFALMLVATTLAFKWFGTTSEDWAGYLCGSLAFVIASRLVSTNEIRVR